MKARAHLRQGCHRHRQRDLAVSGPQLEQSRAPVPPAGSRRGGEFACASPCSSRERPARPRRVPASLECMPQARAAHGQPIGYADTECRQHARQWVNEHAPHPAARATRQACCPAAPPKQKSVKSPRPAPDASRPGGWRWPSTPRPPRGTIPPRSPACTPAPAVPRPSGERANPVDRPVSMRAAPSRPKTAGSVSVRRRPSSTCTSVRVSGPPRPYRPDPGPHRRRRVLRRSARRGTPGSNRRRRRCCARQASAAPGAPRRSGARSAGVIRHRAGTHPSRCRPCRSR